MIAGRRGHEDGQANAAGDGDEARAVGRDLLEGGEVEVEGEDGRSFGVLPGGLVLIGVGSESAASGAAVAWGELADADDVAFDGAAEAVGEGLEGGLRGGRGLDLGGPEAGERSRERGPGEAARCGARRRLRSGEGEEAERGGEEQ